MTAPPWGHKPPAVDDPERYWCSPPPRLSERCEYWLRRWREGSWRPNKYLRSEDRHGRAAVLGIYVWEVLHVLGPLIDEYEQRLGRPSDQQPPGLSEFQAAVDRYLKQVKSTWSPEMVAAFDALTAADAEARAAHERWEQVMAARVEHFRRRWTLTFRIPPR